MNSHDRRSRTDRFDAGYAVIAAHALSARLHPVHGKYPESYFIAKSGRMVMHSRAWPRTSASAAAEHAELPLSVRFQTWVFFSGVRG